MDLGGSSWSLLTVVGPILLAVALLWALLRNRKKNSPADIERTERATHDLYDAEQAAHRDEDNRGV